jgi:hypothetical protein
MAAAPELEAVATAGTPPGAAASILFRAASGRNFDFAPLLTAGHTSYRSSFRTTVEPLRF